MSFFDKKKRDKRFDFFTDFEELDKYMQSLMDELMKGFSSPDEFYKSAKSKPVRWGFSIRFNKDGVPMIREFGNIKRTEGKPVFSDKREPLVNIDCSNGEVIITAELPGVKKEEIDIKAEKDRVIIDVDNSETPYFKEIELSEIVKPKSIKAKFKNGILEITLEKEKTKKSKRKEHKVRIE